MFFKIVHDIDFIVFAFQIYKSVSKITTFWLLFSYIYPVEYNRIKYHLKARGMKVVDLARNIGRSREVTSGYVNNHKQPSIEMLFKIAEVLEIDPRELINPVPHEH